MSFVSFSRRGMHVGRLSVGLIPTNEENQYLLMSWRSGKGTFGFWRWMILRSPPHAGGGFDIGGSYCCESDPVTYECLRRSILPGGRRGSGYCGFYVRLPILGSLSFHMQPAYPK